MIGKRKQIWNTTIKHEPLLWARKFPDWGSAGTQGFQKKELGL